MLDSNSAMNKILSKIQIENLTFKYEDEETDEFVLKNLNLSIEEGGFVSVVGGSGCGKSTLLNLIAGLRKITSGHILIDGKEINAPGIERGVVFQDYSLFPWMTAKDNIVFALSQLKNKTTKVKMHEKAEKYLDLVGLANSKNKYPLQLSGGMQQRVAIARAFAMDSQILLMDEPFSALDAKNRMDLQDLLLELWQKKENGKVGKTVFFVTHDITEAILLSDRVIIMSNTEHSIIADVPIPFARPREHEKLVNSEEFNDLRDNLVNMLYAEIENNEVAL